MELVPLPIDRQCVGTVLRGAPVVALDQLGQAKAPVDLVEQISEHELGQ